MVCTIEHRILIYATIKTKCFNLLFSHIIKQMIMIPSHESSPVLLTMLSINKLPNFEIKQYISVLSHSYKRKILNKTPFLQHV